MKNYFEVLGILKKTWILDREWERARAEGGKGSDFHTSSQGKGKLWWCWIYEYKNLSENILTNTALLVSSNWLSQYLITANKANMLSVVKI